MAKKQEQLEEIVENEPVAINEKDIVPGEELKETDAIGVNVPKAVIEEKANEEVKEKAKKEAEEKAKAEEEAKEKAKAEEEAKAKAKAEEEAKAKAKAEEEAKAKAEKEKVKLKVLISFTDKYTKKDYAINDEILVDKDRAKELLTDSRRLVTKLD